MAEQPPKPDHVKAMEQIKAKSEEVTQIIDTIEHSKGKHYHLAVEKLRDSKTKRINYKLLDASKYGDYYHHKVADEFINNLKKDVREMYHMKDDYKMSDSEANLLLGGVYGVTKKSMMDLFAKNGSKLTVSGFKDIIDEYTKELQQRLLPTIGDHIKDKDLPAILKEINANKFLKEKDLNTFANPLYKDDIVGLVSQFYQSGSLTQEHIKKTQLLSKHMPNDPKYVNMYKKDEEAMKKTA